MPDLPFIGEISYVSFDYAPRGFALCNGQLLPIFQNQALFAVLGTTYGGNGQTNFALPDLRGRMPVHIWDGAVHGQTGGAEVVTLSANQMPVHQHQMPATSSAANLTTPTTGATLAAVDARTFGDAYATPASPVAMDAQAVTSVGGSQPHDNTQPSLTMTAIIALQGVMPSAG